MQPTAHRRRFSLVEMLVVTAILILVTSITIVSIAPMMRDRRLRSGGRAVQTALRQARSYAAHSRRNTTVFFDHEHDGPGGLIEIACFLICLEDGHGDLIVPGDICDECGHAGETVPDRLFEADLLPDGIQFQGSPDPVTFTPLGSLSGTTGTRTVTIEDIQQNLSLDIRITGASGIVRVGEIE